LETFHSTAHIRQKWCYMYKKYGRSHSHRCVNLKSHAVITELFKLCRIHVFQKTGAHVDLHWGPRFQTCGASSPYHQYAVWCLGTGTTYLWKKESSKCICYGCMYSNQVKFHFCFIPLYNLDTKNLKKKNTYIFVI
jgi:hypothetical protein